MFVLYFLCCIYPRVVFFVVVWMLYDGLYCICCTNLFVLYTYGKKNKKKGVQFFLVLISFYIFVLYFPCCIFVSKENLFSLDWENRTDSLHSDLSVFFLNYLSINKLNFLLLLIIFSLHAWYCSILFSIAFNFHCYYTIKFISHNI